MRPDSGTFFASRMHEAIAANIADACMQLGQQVQGLESQLGLMEHQARSLNQDKEQLEEELQDKQALLDQAAAAAHQAETQAAHNSQALLER